MRAYIRLLNCNSGGAFTILCISFNMISFFSDVLIYSYNSTKMALSGSQYSTEELTRTKGEMEDFLADEAKLAKTRELLKTVADDSIEAKTLKVC